MNTEIELFKDSSCLASPTSASADQLQMQREDFETVIKICELLIRKVDLDIQSTNVVSTLAIKATNSLKKFRK